MHEKVIQARFERFAARFGHHQTVSGAFENEVFIARNHCSMLLPIRRRFPAATDYHKTRAYAIVSCVWASRYTLIGDKDDHQTSLQELVEGLV